MPAGAVCYRELAHGLGTGRAGWSLTGMGPVREGLADEGTPEQNLGK